MPSKNHLWVKLKLNKKGPDKNSEKSAGSDYSEDRSPFPTSTPPINRISPTKAKLPWRNQFKSLLSQSQIQSTNNLLNPRKYFPEKDPSKKQKPLVLNITSPKPHPTNPKDHSHLPWNTNISPQIICPISPTLIFKIWKKVSSASKFSLKKIVFLETACLLTSRRKLTTASSPKNWRNSEKICTGRKVPSNYHPTARPIPQWPSQFSSKPNASPTKPEQNHQPFKNKKRKAVHSLPCKISLTNGNK